MASKEKRIAVDSCVFVNILTGGSGNDEPDWLRHGKALLKAADDGEFAVAISALTIAEVFGTGSLRGTHVPRDLRRSNIERAQKWLTAHRFRVVETDEMLAQRAADLALNHQLKGGDAVVLAAALRSRATELYTWDDDLLKLGGRLDGIEVLRPSSARIQEHLLTLLPDKDIADVPQHT